ARSAAVSVTDNAAGSPQTVSLTGTGTTPAATLSPTSLSFGDRQISSLNSTHDTTSTDSGAAPLNISSISLTGANTGDFNQTNNCPLSLSTLAVNRPSTHSFPARRSSDLARSAAVSVTDDVAGSPQTVSLT